jgi:hypothetical protein
VICFAYDDLTRTGELLHTRPNCPEPAGRFNASHVPTLSLMPGLTCERTEVLLRDGRPFVYPIELAWDWSQTLSCGPSSLAPGMPPGVIESIRKGRASLLLLLVEAAHLEPDPHSPLWLFDYIQQFIAEHDLPSERVWFVSGRATGLPEFATWLHIRGLYEPEAFQFRALQPWPSWVRAFHRANAQGWDVVTAWHDDDSVSVEKVPFSADAFAARYVAPDEIAAEQRAGTLRPKRFLSMNRHCWPHRVYIASYLQARGYLDDSLVSFAAAPAGFYDAFPAPVLEELLQLGWAKLQPRLPLSVDLGPPSAIGYATDAQSKLENGAPYRARYVNIATETSTYPPAYYSEKTLKPILNLQPFVCVAPPHSLRYLRALGFQTFGRVIDESYDLDGDAATRFSRLFHVIDTLGQLSPSQARDLYVECLPEMTHNRTHLIEGRHQLDVLWDELAAQLS